MKRWGTPVVAAVLCTAFAVVRVLPDINERTVIAVSDVAMLVAPLLAALCCAVAARADHARQRTWWLLCLGTLAWAAGQSQWTFTEILTARQPPFPSWADVGFTAFPLLSAIGLLGWTARRRTVSARLRDLLDGGIIAACLLILSWVSVLGPAARDSSGGPVAVGLSLLYPVGDIVLATLVLFALARSAREGRAPLAVLALGLGGLSLADSAYVYLAAAGTYSSDDWVTGGWLVGFCLVAVAARMSAAAARVPEAAPRPGTAPAPGLVSLLMPYIPIGVVMVGVLPLTLRSQGNPRAIVVLGSILVVLVLARQFVALIDNRQLVIALRDVHDQLHHQALHDPLTGLPNRTLFGERLDRALLARDHDIAVFFCDVDDFKAVNDAHGHDAGDVLLRQVADRLLSCVRATDTVARLGGDEFAILVVESVDVREMGERVVAAMTTPYDLGHAEATVSISVGIAEHSSASRGSGTRRVHDRRFSRGSGVLGEVEREHVARSLLTRADTAMYAAKRGGKGRAVLVTPGDEHGSVTDLTLTETPDADLA